MLSTLSRLSNTTLYVLATLVWGSTWLVITFQYGTVPPAASVAWRFLLAGVVLLAWCVSRGESLRLPRREYAWCALQGVLLFGVSYVCVYEAEQYIASGLMAVLNSSMLVFNLIGMRLAFGQAFDRRNLTGAALGLLGITLVFWPELATVQTADNWRGVAFGCAAALIASLGNLVAQRNRNVGQPLMVATGFAMVFGAASALALTAVQGQPIVFDMRISYVAALLYLALFGSVLAFLAYFTLMGRIGASRASYVVIAVPILALVLSGFFEGLVWSVWTVIGILCAVAGNWVMLRGK